VKLNPSYCGDSSLNVPAASNYPVDRIENTNSGKILFVIRHHDAVVCLCDGGDDHVERASRSACRLPFGHQARPGESRFVVEGKNAAREKCLRSLSP